MDGQMMVITVAGLKGGVGKTTTATNLAYLLAAEHGKRVLLVDADCQGNSSEVYGVRAVDGGGMAALMSGLLEKPEEGTQIRDFICSTGYGIDIIPADGYLMETNGRIIADGETDQIHFLSECLQQCREEYDFCIIDCGLQLDMTVLNAILASDLVVSPLRIGGFELSAVDNLLAQAEDMWTPEKRIQTVCLLTMYSNNKVSREVETWFRNQRRYDLFRTHIRNSVVVTRNTLCGGPLAARSKNSNAVKDYRAVAEELLERMGVV